MDTEKKVEIRSVPWTEANITERIAEYENRDWSALRGNEGVDYNNELLLIRASIEEVADELSQMYQTTVWERDVLGREVTIGNYGLFVFRLRGHSWTEVVRYNFYLTMYEEQVQSLSHHLNTRVIKYGCSDTAGCAGYSLYDRGELLEDYCFLEDGYDDESEQVSEYQGPRLTFTSSIRDIPASEVSIGEIFKEEDALEPGIRGEYFLDYTKHSPGEKVAIQNPGFQCIFPGRRVAISRPEFERVDYLRLED